jgi:hypothetical protein
MLKLEPESEQINKIEKYHLNSNSILSINLNNFFFIIFIYLKIKI